MILGIHHVQVTVGREDVAAARDFYVGVLGLAEIEKPDSLKGRGGFWVQVGERVVHVGVEEGGERWKSKAHVAYRVDDIGAWRARLAAADVEIIESVPIAGYERFEFRDPFGNRVEMIEVVTDG